MSYMNGIGSQQPFSGTVEIAASSRATRTVKAESGTVTGQNGFGGALDRATVSSTGNAVAQALSGGNVYNQKVAALQQSIMAGTYSVPASDVAAKVLSVMLH